MNPSWISGRAAIDFVEPLALWFGAGATAAMLFSGQSLVEMSCLIMFFYFVFLYY